MNAQQESLTKRVVDSFPNLPPGDSNAPQTYANHRRMPLLYMAAEYVLIIEIVIRVRTWFGDQCIGNFWAILVSCAFLAVWFYSRHSAIIVQNRLIRLEMRLRLQQCLPVEQHGEIDRLRVGQLVALRFAGDEELSGLVHEVLEQNLTNQNQIKRKIKNWQPDWLRV